LIAGRHLGTLGWKSEETIMTARLAQIEHMHQRRARNGRQHIRADGKRRRAADKRNGCGRTAVGAVAEPLRSEGVLLIERPDLIRWETTAPYQSILLGNHKSVAQFERTEGDWKKLKLAFPQMLRRVMEQMVQMHQGRLDALTGDYTISVATGSVAVVTLVPKDEMIRSMLSSLEVKMQPDFSATREVVMNEPSGELTRIIFRRERRDVKFPSRTFDQVKPLDIAAIKAALGNAP